MNIKVDRITLLREFLVTQMNHWMLFPFYVMFVSILGDITGKGTPRILFWLAFGLIPFLLYLGRYMLKQIWALLLLHLACIFIIFVFPAEHISIKIFQTMIAVGYVIYSIYLWFATTHRNDTKLYPLLGVGLSVIMLIILNNQGHTGWDNIFVAILIIALGLYFVIYYIERYQNFLTVNKSSAGHIPAREMFKSGMGLVIGYTSIGLVILIFVSNFDWLRGVFAGLKKMFAYLLSGFFSLFPKNTGASIQKVEEKPIIETAEPLMFAGEYETFWLWEVLDVLLEIAFTVLIIFGLVRAFMLLVKLIRSKINGLTIHNPKTTVKEDVVDVREKCDIVRSSEWKVRLPFLNLDPKERIRQMYKKRLLASKTALSAGSDVTFLSRYTARESSKILEREELATIYEKARYSNLECNSEDVRHMRNACK